MTLQIIITAIVSLLLGGGVTWFIVNKQAGSKTKQILAEAEKEA